MLLGIYVPLKSFLKFALLAHDIEVHCSRCKTVFNYDLNQYARACLNNAIPLVVCFVVIFPLLFKLKANDALIWLAIIGWCVSCFYYCWKNTKASCITLSEKNNRSGT